MERNEIETIRAGWPQGRVLFPYFKDKYALTLLGAFVGKGKTVGEVKKSRYGGLLQKPLLRTLLRGLPDGKLTPTALASVWQEPPMPQVYRLSLGAWPLRPKMGWKWQQTSRPGANLVLQLNFSNEHNQIHQRLCEQGAMPPLRHFCHPIAIHEYTLAWARLDVDFDTGEALIEEVQSDWLRDAVWHLNRSHYGYEDAFRHYCEALFETHAVLWAEAVLSAALWLLRDHLNVNTIYYHTFDSGTRLKRIDGKQPPRSLYSALPRAFCFEERESVPSFLLEHRHVRKTLREKPVRMFRMEG